MDFSNCPTCGRPPGANDYTITEFRNAYPGEDTKWCTECKRTFVSREENVLHRKKPATVPYNVVQVLPKNLGTGKKKDDGEKKESETTPDKPDLIPGTNIPLPKKEQKAAKAQDVQAEEPDAYEVTLEVANSIDKPDPDDKERKVLNGTMRFLTTDLRFKDLRGTVFVDISVNPPNAAVPSGPPR